MYVRARLRTMQTRHFSEHRRHMHDLWMLCLATDARVCVNSATTRFRPPLMQQLTFSTQSQCRCGQIVRRGIEKGDWCWQLIPLHSSPICVCVCVSFLENSSILNASSCDEYGSQLLFALYSSSQHQLPPLYSQSHSIQFLFASQSLQVDRRIGTAGNTHSDWILLHFLFTQGFFVCRKLENIWSERI